LRYERHPLDTIFAPNNVAIIGASEKAGSVGRTVLWNLISSPFGGTVFPSTQAAQRAGHQGLPQCGVASRAGRSGGAGHPFAGHSGVDQGMRRAGIKGAVVISAGFKEWVPKGPPWSRSCSRTPPGGDAHRGTELPGGDDAASGPERHVRRDDRPAGQRRLHQSVRRPVHRRARLVVAAQRRLQRLRLDRLDGRCQLGRPGRLLRQRPTDPEHHMYMESIGNARSFLSPPARWP